MTLECHDIVAGEKIRNKKESLRIYTQTGAKLCKYRFAKQSDIYIIFSLAIALLLCLKEFKHNNSANVKIQ